MHALALHIDAIDVCMAGTALAGWQIEEAAGRHRGAAGHQRSAQCTVESVCPGRPVADDDSPGDASN
eukprot:COSAG01_NODE_22246_length_864_cov_1.908497_2_plen_67_part_00